MHMLEGCCCEASEEAKGEILPQHFRWANEDSEPMEVDNGFNGCDSVQSLDFVPESEAFESPKDEENFNARLSTELQDMSLLRGAQLRHILRGFGWHFRSSTISSYAEGEELYSKSVPVEKIAYFISHRWSDGRFGKLVTLWIHSNLLVAMLISTLVAAVCVCLAHAGLLPAVDVPYLNHAFFPWALLLGYISFFLVLMTWHNVAVPWLKPPFYFLDKLCLHQTDAELKLAGVASLAAFIASSEHMLLLWTPKYFESLWCMLEFCAVVRSNAPSPCALPQIGPALDFLPMQLSKLSFFIWSTLGLGLFTVQINTLANHPVPEVYLVAGSAFGALYAQTIAFRQYAHDRRALKEQLRTFSLQNAVCSDPGDRITILETILDWFGVTEVELCNHHIRQMMSDRILATLGPRNHFPSHLLIPILLVHLFLNADYAAYGWFSTNTERKVMGPLIGFGVWLTLTVPASFRLCHIFPHKMSNRCGNLLLNLVLTTIITGSLLGGWQLNHHVVGSSSTPLWLAALIICLECALLLLLQRASLQF